jgi:hypothetical protein
VLFVRHWLGVSLLSFLLIPNLQKILGDIVKMERVRTIVRPLKSDKKLFYNVEDILAVLGISFEYWQKKWNSFEKNVNAQRKCGYNGLLIFFKNNQFIEEIKGATGIRQDLYCSKDLITEILQIGSLF